MASPIMPNTPMPPPPMGVAGPPPAMSPAEQLRQTHAAVAAQNAVSPFGPGGPPQMRGSGNGGFASRRQAAGAGPNRAKGGPIKAKKYAKGGSVSSASKRADGCVSKGKTKGKMV